MNGTVSWHSVQPQTIFRVFVSSSNVLHEHSVCERNSTYGDYLGCFFLSLLSCRVEVSNKKAVAWKARGLTPVQKKNSISSHFRKFWKFGQVEPAYVELWGGGNSTYWKFAKKKFQLILGKSKKKSTLSYPGGGGATKYGQKIKMV